MSLMQCKKFRMQSIIYFLSFCILTWIECLIFSFVFVVIGMYNLILLTSSICLVDRYEETPALQKSIWINNPLILQCSRLNICFYNFIMFTLNPANVVDCTANPTNLKKHFKHIIIHVRYLRN